MKKLLLFFALCTSVTTWAQTKAEFSESSDGTTLTITANGDLTTYSMIDNSGKKFTSAAVGNVYTNNTGTGVSAGSSYDPSAEYYSAEKTWTPQFEGGAPSGTTYVKDVKDVVSVNVPTGKILWRINAAQSGWNGSAAVNGIQTGTAVSSTDAIDLSTWTFGGYENMSYYFLLDEGKSLGTYTHIGFDDLSSYGITLLSKTDFEAITTTEKKYTCNFNDLYVSADGGTTKTLLTNGTVYTYHEGETFYTASNTYNKIENNATYFAENSSYLVVDPVEKTFAQALAAKIKAGDYTKVQFVNTAAPAALTINEAIVTAILYPNGNNSWFNTDVKTLDLGQTTLPGLTSDVFAAGSVSGNGYFVNNISVTDLTLPLVPAVDGEVIVPANVVSAWSTNAVVPGCERLTTVRIPEGYTKLADNAFSGLKWVSEFELPSTLKEIGNSAFENSGSITSIEFKEGLTYIGKRAFMGTSLSYVEFPTSVRKIDQAAFANIEQLNTFKLNQGLEFIGNSAFHAHSEELAMEVLDIPSTVKYIGPSAFNFRVFTDMYFHSAQAPICPVGPSVLEDKGDVPFIYDICYEGNGGQNAGNHPNADRYTEGYANRENYTNGNYWFLMVHFPSSAECPDLDVSSYKDETRVYHKFYGSIYDQKGQVIGVPGYEDQYKDYTWSFADTREYVGKETSALTFDGKSTMNEGGRGYVTSGYEDTYRGLNYIWPSQTQYIRAHTTVALGYNWDGVTKYRPELTDEQIAYMIEDGLQIKDPTTGNRVTLTGSTKLTEAQANAYNATLPGAWYVGEPYDWYTDEEAKAVNRETWKDDENYQIGKTALYTNDEVDALNADVEGAVKIGDVKTPATEAVYMSYEEFCAVEGAFVYTGDADKESFYNEAIELIKSGQAGWDSKMSVDPFKSPASDAVLYDKESANAHNETVDGATLYDAVKTTITEDNLDDILAALEGAVREGYVKSMREEAEVIEHNKTLDGHKSANETMDNTDFYADYLSLIAFQSTRRCVFAANDGRPGPYPVPITDGKKWWTICMPFDLTKAQIDKYFGVGSHVCLFNKVDREEPKDGKKGTIRLYFTDDQYTKAATDNDVVLRAHVSYMIFPTITYADAVSKAWEIPAGEYDLKTGNPIPTFVSANIGTGEGKCAAGCTDENHDHTQYRFIGNYDTKLPMESENIENAQGRGITLMDVVVPQYSYIYAVKGTESETNKAQFWFTQSSKIKWLPNKCVVQASARDGGLVDNTNFFGGSENNVKQISIFGDMEYFDDATDIDDVVIIAGNGEDSEVIYNLNGQQLNAVPQHGIYIKNGKKYLAR